MRKLLFLLCCAIVYGAPQSIREIDWKNFSYPLIETDHVPAEVRWMRPAAKQHVSLINGRYVASEGCKGKIASCPLVSFDSARYGALTGVPSSVAAVVLSYHSGGTATWQYLYLFALESGKPRLLAWLKTGSRADQGLRDVSMRDGNLVLIVEDPDKRQGDCCSAGSITFRYRWMGSSFSVTGSPVRKIDPPSFDCTKAATPVEHLICKDAELSFLDSQMATSYQEVLKDAAAAGKEVIRKKQAEWFADYSRTCNAPLSDEQRRDCINRHLSDRLVTIWK